MQPHGYVGRFAPSPTGPLHIGSLVAAVGSYLQAKKQQGKWLLRMEDLDPPREEPGAADKIFRSLEAHGLFWDDEVIFQSQRHDIYESIVYQLIEQDLAYHCYCTRKQLSEQARKDKFGLIYPGTCRDRDAAKSNTGQYSTRVKTHDQLIAFTDARTGIYSQKLESELGDFIIKRSDGLFAYQIAVVVDDARQKITEVVRGEDLLDNTPRQIHLQQLLDYPTPEYLHLPLVRNKNGQKLSKQTHAAALDDHLASYNLVTAIQFLGIEIPLELHHARPNEIMSQAISLWSPPSS